MVLSNLVELILVGKKEVLNHRAILFAFQSLSSKPHICRIHKNNEYTFCYSRYVLRLFCKQSNRRRPEIIINSARFASIGAAKLSCSRWVSRFVVWREWRRWLRAHTLNQTVFIPWERASRNRSRKYKASHSKKTTHRSHCIGAHIFGPRCVRFRDRLCLCGESFHSRP